MPSRIYLTLKINEGQPIYESLADPQKTGVHPPEKRDKRIDKKRQAMNNRHLIPKLFSGLLNLLICSIATAAILYKQDWFGSSDIRAFIICTIPLALGLAVSGETLLHLIRNLPFVLRLPIIMVLTGLLSLGWGFSVVLISGRWIEALGIPVLVLWIGGSTVQLLFLDWRLPKPAAESKVSKVLLVFLSIPLTLVAGFLAIYFFAHVYSYLTRPERETFLFPKNFRGEVYVIFNQKNGEPKEYENNRRLYKIPDNGVLFTQFKAEYGRVDQEFYFVDRTGKRTEFVLNEEWISAKNASNPLRDSAVVFRVVTGQRGKSSPEDSTAFYFTNFIVKTYNQPWQSGNELSSKQIDSIRTAYLKNKGNREVRQPRHQDGFPPDQLAADCDDPAGKPLDGLNNIMDGLNIAGSIPDQELLQMQKIYSRRKKSIQENQYWQKTLGLPETARIIEMAPVEGVRTRAVILYMNRPIVSGEPGASWCGSRVEGDAGIVGDAHFSLVNIPNKKIINTLVYKDLDPESEMGGCLRVPLFYLNEENGQVKEMGRRSSGGQQLGILILKDLNGDRIPGDFLVSEYLSCGNLMDMMIGYNPESDRLQRYAFDLTVTNKNTASGKDSVYQDILIRIPNLSGKMPDRKGVIAYKHDYAHGSGTGYIYHLQYNRSKGKFEGTLICVPVSALNE